MSFILIPLTARLGIFSFAPNIVAMVFRLSFQNLFTTASSFFEVTISFKIFIIRFISVNLAL
jgi:hypothetical protein